MPFYPSTRNFALLLAGLLGTGLGGCAVYGQPYAGGGYVQTMPPAGIAYYDYWYYPGVQVYYDINRHVYFYLSSSGWLEVRVLPPALRARLGRHVPIHSRYARPYREHNDHRRKYPSNYREAPPPSRNNGGRSPYPHNYYPPAQAPVKKAPQQYRYERRQDQEYQRREEHREQPRYQQQGPLKRPPADYKRNGHSKDQQSGKSSDKGGKYKDNKRNNDKHKKSSGRDRDRRDQQDRNDQNDQGDYYR